MKNRMIVPLLRLLPPEKAHGLTLRALKWGLAGRAPIPDPKLRVRLWGQDFPSPLGLAAGFDKQGQVMGAMLNLGLGFVEVGTITPDPQPGNAKPRVFRAPQHRALINSYGFNSDGHHQVYDRIAAWRQQNPGAAVGINLGMNKGAERPIAAYQQGIAKFENLASYMVINLSSPNTKGLREQQTAGLADLIRGLQDARTGTCPILIKVAPDLDPAEIAQVAQIAGAQGLDGLIVANTTLARPDGIPAGFAARAGGLSGAPLRDRALACLRAFYNHLKGQVPLIGVGGLMNGADAVARLRAGADLLQVYTGLVYAGPPLIQSVNAAILKALDQEALDSPEALKGTDI